MMRRRATACGLLAALLAGCNVVSDVVYYDPGPTNDCSTGCGAGQCESGLCVARETNYRIIFEVIPPPAVEPSGVALIANDGVDERSGGARSLLVPSMAQVSVSLDDPLTASAIPISVRLDRIGALPGTAQPSFYRTQSDASTPLTLRVPPGSYSVYVAPTAASDRARLAPVRPGTLVALSGESVDLHINGTTASRSFTLTMQEQAPAGTMGGPTTLSRARDVFVVDPNNGDVLSSVTSTCGGDLGTATIAQIWRSLPTGALLRVAPPSTKCPGEGSTGARATYDFDLATLDIDGSGRATVTLPTEAPVAVNVAVSALPVELQPLSFSWRFRSTALTGAATTKSVAAFYQLTSMLPTTGEITSALLLPGNYEVDVVPTVSENTSSTNRAACVGCTLTAAGGGARVSQFRVISTGIDATYTTDPVQVYLAPRAKLVGRALTLDGHSTLWPGTATATSSALQTTRDGAYLVARPSFGTFDRDANGSAPDPNLSLPVDFGRYDITVKLPDVSAYPWVVWPQFDADPSGVDGSGTLTLPGAMVATTPVVLRGEVLDSAAASVPNARIRAHAVLCDASGAEVSTVPVGETQSGADGSYRLLLPSSLSGTIHACASAP
jgi:hypothetical protein